VRGIISTAGYVPYRRLQRSEIGAFFGTGGTPRLGVRRIVATNVQQMIAKLALDLVPEEGLREPGLPRDQRPAGQ